MLHLVSRLEVNVLPGAVDVDDLVTFVLKNRIPAIVVSPEFVETVVVMRGNLINRFKVICAVDFPEGRCFANEKIINLPRGALNADGFDVMLSAGRTDKECMNELAELSRFFRDNLAGKELRYCLGLRGRKFEDVVKFFKHFRKFPAEFIRTDGNLSSPKNSLKQHQSDIRFISEHSKAGIKLCGDVDFDVMCKLERKVARFDVSLDQARRIIKDVRKPVLEKKS